MACCTLAVYFYAPDCAQNLWVSLWPHKTMNISHQHIHWESNSKLLAGEGTKSQWKATPSNCIVHSMHQSPSTGLHVKTHLIPPSCCPDFRECSHNFILTMATTVLICDIAQFLGPHPHLIACSMGKAERVWYIISRNTESV